MVAASELPANPNTNMQAAQEGRDGHCKQTRRWQDVTQICLQGPLNCSLRTERGGPDNKLVTFQVSLTSINISNESMRRYLAGVEGSI